VPPLSCIAQDAELLVDGADGVGVAPLLR